MKHRRVLGGWLGVLMTTLLAGPALAETPPAGCVECHRTVTPGIVEQYLKGAMGQKGLDCAICHGTAHKRMDDAAKAVLPTPQTCAPCHEQQVLQFRNGKHALAWVAMKAMPMVTHQPIPVVAEGFKGCSGCHKIGEKREEELTRFRYGTGSCDACHTRHTFSKQEARDPRACQTCHMGFDHPQWEMWSTSKHGTIWAIEGGGRAPVCQTCHMPGGDHAVMTAWGFLALRLPEKDQAWLADRVEILKALGVLDDQGKPTERLEAVKAAKMARLTEEEWQREREKMLTVCSQCHSKSFARDQLAAGDTIIREADRILAEAIREVRGLYAAGILKTPSGWRHTPDLLQFYEAQSTVEQELYLMFLEYRMRAFQGAFHANPDYMHWYGWAKLKEASRRIKDEVAALQAKRP